MPSHTNDICFCSIVLNMNSAASQIMKVVLQYIDVHWLPVTHFTQIMATLGITRRQYFL